MDHRVRNSRRIAVSDLPDVNQHSLITKSTPTNVPDRVETHDDFCIATEMIIHGQCANDMPRPSATRSNGSARLQTAVMRNTAAETKRGKEGEIDKNIPAVMGAMTPVLHVSLSQSYLAKLTTDSGQPKCRMQFL